VRESGHSWKELLLDLERRHLVVASELAIADGAQKADAASTGTSTRQG
jgi:hypothetical protein